jgi:hypothetical protein
MNKQIMGAILVLNLLIGCATQQITPIRRGEPLSIVFTRSPQADGVNDIHNEDLGSNTWTGAGTGATGGAVAGAIAGLSCGPFFFICSPVYALGGAIVGTAAGAGVGAGVGITGELSSEKAAQLRDRVMCVQQSHSLLSELQKNVNDRAQKYWKLGTDQSAALVTIELQDLLLSSMRGEQINCTIRVLLSVQRAVAKDSKTTERKMYQYAAPSSSLSIWLDESSDFIDTVLTSASQQISVQIVSDLAKDEEKANLLATPPAVPPAGTPVALRPNAPTFNPVEPWTGKWKVTDARHMGTWALKQTGDEVVSTNASDYVVEAKVHGSTITGIWYEKARSLGRGEIRATISVDGLSFQATTYPSREFTAKKIE